MKIYEDIRWGPWKTPVKLTTKLPAQHHHIGIFIMTFVAR